MKPRQFVMLLYLAISVLAASHPATARDTKGHSVPDLAALYRDNPHVQELLRLEPAQFTSPVPGAPGLAGLYEGNAHIKSLLQLKAGYGLLGAR
jgi:hypothetical protein